MALSLSPSVPFAAELERQGTTLCSRSSNGTPNGFIGGPRTAASRQSCMFSSGHADLIHHTYRQKIATVHRATAGRRRRGTAPVAGLFGLGFPELLVIGGVAAVLFGPKQLPALGKSLGQTAKSFQQAANEFQSELKSSAEEAKEKVEQAADAAKKPEK